MDNIARLYVNELVDRRSSITKPTRKRTTEVSETAARKTSESTALVAKHAEESASVPARRNESDGALTWVGQAASLDRRISKSLLPTAPTSAPAEKHDLPSLLSPAALSRRTITPMAWKVKSEQARLLTLLRTLHPLVVVDQLCKALAFFGGIPGAPPMDAGRFPDSAEGNGPGSFFISWVGEIFPDTQGSQTPRSVAAQPACFGSHDPPEHLIQEHVPHLIEGDIQPKQAREELYSQDRDLSIGSDSGKSTCFLPPTAHPTQEVTNGTSSPHNNWNESVQSGDLRPANGVLLGPQDANDVGPSGDRLDSSPVFVNTPARKRRGRPKGSKNRPKPPAECGLVFHSETAAQVDGVLQQPASLTKPPQKRTGPGRPKGSKNKPKVLSGLVPSYKSSTATGSSPNTSFLSSNPGVTTMGQAVSEDAIHLTAKVRSE
jgi:hypothetical protein